MRYLRAGRHSPGTWSLHRSKKARDALEAHLSGVRLDSPPFPLIQLDYVQNCHHFFSGVRMLGVSLPSSHSIKSFRSVPSIWEPSARRLSSA